MFQERYQQAAAFIQAEKPDTVAYLAYLDDDHTEVTMVYVFPDAAAMDRHLDGGEEHSARAAGSSSSWSSRSTGRQARRRSR